MNILHISLGDPERHSGGLNRYCQEIMEQQRAEGNIVYILFPGGFSLRGKPYIKRRTAYKYELVNPLPVPITYGVDNPERYMKPCDKKIFIELLNLMNIDIIHIHSIQGIYKEFFEAASCLGTPMILTTHDYYPICLKSTLLKDDYEICEKGEKAKCAECNKNAGLSMAKQILLQSNIYPYIKRSFIVNKVKYRILNRHIKRKNETVAKSISNKEIEKIDALMNYYAEIVDCCSCIHCNSISTYNIYKRVFQTKFDIIPITHKGIIRRKHKRKEKEHISFGYMGGLSVYKGYEQFKNALDKLDAMGIHNWDAYFYGAGFDSLQSKDARKHYCGLFSKEDEQYVWDCIDVLVVSSQCRETFGFVVLEALSQGIPVICSNLVGSSYLVQQISDTLIYEYNCTEMLAQKMENMFNDEYYNELCREINSKHMNISMKAHNKDIEMLYIKTIEGKHMNVWE